MSETDLTKPTLTISTVMYRMENLPRLIQDISRGLEYFNIQWRIALHTNPSTQGNILRAVYAVQESPLIGHTRFHSFQCAPEWASFTGTNINLDATKDGWFWICDDDNVPHPAFFSTMRGLVGSGHLGWIFAQYLVPQSQHRQVFPDRVRVGNIDAAQYCLRRDFIGDHRYPMEYGADGIFIQRIHEQNPGKIGFTNQTLCFYNALRT